MDLERPSDVRKLTDPELYFRQYQDRLVCLDEIQRQPDLFPLLRGVIDEHRRNGRFLILGSASRNLIRQSSESLASRIAYLELTPFLLSEVAGQSPVDPSAEQSLWLYGGFPDSYLARTTTASLEWRETEPSSSGTFHSWASIFRRKPWFYWTDYLAKKMVIRPSDNSSLSILWRNSCSTAWVSMAGATDSSFI